MERFARIVLGYHGARVGEPAEYAKQLLVGEVDVAEWRQSENEYDWLGHGIYFWEHSPERARRWAGEDGIVIGAVIQLGNCLDLMDPQYTALLTQSFAALEIAYRENELSLPENKGPQVKRRELDCLVINYLTQRILADVDTVRCAFEEGDAAFPGAALKMETHVQMAVLKHEAILGIFRPTFAKETAT